MANSATSQDLVGQWRIMKLLVFVFCAAALVSSAADRILMTRLGPSKASLMIADLDGTGERALTEGTLDYNPAWSADGKWIAFTSERNGSADLYRIRADGSGVERLTNDPSYDDQARYRMSSYFLHTTQASS
jgi:Tol biopolymer transport system component